MRKYGRKEPYTEIGIRRLTCFRCGASKPQQQWQICADDNLYRPICNKCDVELNEMVLKWAGIKNWRSKLKRYKKQLG